MKGDTPRARATRKQHWFAEVTQKRVRRGAFRSLSELEKAIREYIEAHNEALKPFTWVKSADEILASIARLAKNAIATHPSV